MQEARRLAGQAGGRPTVVGSCCGCTHSVPQYMSTWHVVGADVRVGMGLGVGMGVGVLGAAVTAAANADADAAGSGLQVASSVDKSRASRFRSQLAMATRGAARQIEYSLLDRKQVNGPRSTFPTSPGVHGNKQLLWA